MKLICPNDGKELINKPNSLACPLCKKNFNKEENLISFLDSEDSFYEGAFKNSVNFVPSRNIFLNSLSIWTLNHLVVGSNPTGGTRFYKALPRFELYHLVV